MACLPAFGVTGEERRYPYLDQSLVEFLLAIPPDQLLRPGQRRSLMRRALGGVVPKEILWRKTKAFVSRSVLVAFDKSWPELQELFSSPIAGARGYVISPELLKDLQLAKSGNAEHMMYLLKVISLELWLRSVATHGLIRVPGASDLHRRSLAPRGTSPSPLSKLSCRQSG
jgi:asparagine synthase (glutamine-hydrolysing)